MLKLNIDRYALIIITHQMLSSIIETVDGTM